MGGVEMRDKFPKDTEAWRVFCAVEFPEFLRQRIIDHIARLKGAAPDAPASWSRPDNIHLTLKFLGDIPQSSILNLSDAASRSVAGLAPFTIRLEGPDAFPPHGAPKVLWIGVTDVEGKLEELQRRLEDEGARSGFPKESRLFHPHLTLARLRKPQRAETLASAHKAMVFEPVEFVVSDLLVIRSELNSAGSKYSTISRHPLCGLRRQA
jgi:2'-5' RNA ligase